MSQSATPSHRRVRTKRPPGHDHHRPLGPLPADWKSLAHTFLNVVRNQWHDTAFCDGTGASLTYGQTLVRAAVLGRFLARNLGDEPYVGVLLPPMVPAAVANLALVLQGKIPVNLNYTASQAMIDSADRAVRHHARDHVAQGPRQVPDHREGQLIMLEDVPRQIR